MARITVVGEHPGFLDAMYAALDGVAGHEVTQFDADETTLRQVIASAPQLLIVDLRLAGEEMKGWDMLLLAREDLVLRSVPLIVCVANAPGLRQRATEFARAGNAWTLGKPFSGEDVDVVVGRALNGG